MWLYQRFSWLLNWFTVYKDGMGSGCGGVGEPQCCIVKASSQVKEDECTGTVRL
jgi:hypothetical protein